MIWTLSQVALGGAIGSVLRFLTAEAALRAFGPSFPVGTLAVNVSGSLAMGALFVVLAERDALHLSPLLMVGLLGGFTTFSAFSLDAWRLVTDGAPVAAAAYVLGSVALSVGALVLGILLARLALG